MPNADLRHLPRLDRSLYQGFAAVHWRMRVEPTTVGWLDDRFHLQFRELLVHACARERLCCPAYCLMPDHLHLMWMGLALESDQLNGMKFLRTYLNRLLTGETVQKRTPAADSRPQPQGSRSQLQGSRRQSQAGWHLQPQAYDHVLREEEQQQGAFASVCFYILANPVRAGLVAREQAWAFSGAVLLGYPDLHPLAKGYWELFWKLYYQHREEPPKAI